MLQNISTSASTLIDSINETAAELDRIGGTDLADALDALEGAAQGAAARLEQAADRSRSVLLGLACRLACVAQQLGQDINRVAEVPVVSVSALPVPITPAITAKVAVVDPAPAAAPVITKGVDTIHPAPEQHQEQEESVAVAANSPVAQVEPETVDSEEEEEVTTADAFIARTKAVRKLLREQGQRSNRSIAAEASVGKDYVRKLRAALEEEVRREEAALWAD